MGILQGFKQAVGMDVQEESPQRPVINEEIQKVRKRRMEIQSRLRVLEVESEMYKRDV